MLLVSGCSIGAVDSSDVPIDAMTPAQIFTNPGLRQLATAAQDGDVRRIDRILRRGVNVNGKGKYGITPIFSAFQARNKAGFKALLERGADPNLIFDGYSLLNEIAGYSSTYFMKLALEYGANPNLVQPRLGEIPLYVAVSPYGKQNVPLLIKAGAVLDRSDSEGETPLMNAALSNQYDIVYMLLKASANFRSKNKWGHDLRWYVDLSTHNMNKSSHMWETLQKVITFLKAHDFWPPPKSQQYPW
jgi:ankyrin repeat protein